MVNNKIKFIKTKTFLIKWIYYKIKQQKTAKHKYGEIYNIKWSSQAKKQFFAKNHIKKLPKCVCCPRANLKLKTVLFFRLRSRIFVYFDKKLLTEQINLDFLACV